MIQVQLMWSMSVVYCTERMCHSCHHVVFIHTAVIRLFMGLSCVCGELGVAIILIILHLEKKGRCTVNKWMSKDSSMLDICYRFFSRFSLRLPTPLHTLPYLTTPHYACINITTYLKHYTFRHTSQDLLTHLFIPTLAQTHQHISTHLAQHHNIYTHLTTAPNTSLLLYTPHHAFLHLTRPNNSSLNLTTFHYTATHLRLSENQNWS